MDDLTRVVGLWLHGKYMAEETVLDEIRELTDPIFSARMLVKVTGLPMSRVLPARGKQVRTGGRLAPETLPDILELRSKFDPDMVRAVVQRGTSQGLLAYLTGISQSRISRIMMKEEHEGTVLLA